ncbi:MAG: glycine cleavage system aminomethyltransferase GcvT, partial [Myxococcota bacterium]|nr:glycine cleavage system aminomethyltransferase GcvT [Myxococcota bacterium]
MGLRRTAFFDAHKNCNARLIDFGGWEMPVQYAGILAEHEAVRKSVGLFDVSHMGEIMVRGEGAEQALNTLLSNDVRSVDIGQSQYSAILNPSGGIVDDVFVYRLAQSEYLVCVNASNREKDFDWLVANNPNPDAEITNASDDWAQVAVQGRNAIPLVESLSNIQAEGLSRGAIAQG